MIDTSRLAEQVHRHLRTEILSGERSSGALLREADLAAELKVSRTPIREALRRLAADGFIEIKPNRSAVVRSWDAEQLKNIYQIREALEGLAAELACGRLSDADFAEFDRLDAKLARAGGRARPEQCHQFDVHLHRTIAQRSGNAMLAREIERFHDLVQLVRDRVGDQGDSLRQAHEQHRLIIEALRGGQPDAARKAMVAHIRSSRDAAVKYGAVEAE